MGAERQPWGLGQEAEETQEAREAQGALGPGGDCGVSPKTPWEASGSRAGPGRGWSGQHCCSAGASQALACTPWGAQAVWTCVCRPACLSSWDGAAPPGDGLVASALAWIVGLRPSGSRTPRLWTHCLPGDQLMLLQKKDKLLRKRAAADVFLATVHRRASPGTVAFSPSVINIKGSEAASCPARLPESLQSAC